MNALAPKESQFATAPFVKPAGLLQRKCDCGQHTIAGGSCGACANKSEASLQRSVIYGHAAYESADEMLDAGSLSSSRAQSKHDFSRVHAHSDARVPARLWTVRDTGATDSDAGADNIFINGPGPGAPAPARAAGSCPTNISVADVGQGNDTEFGRKGPITGWGGFARMDVSDPSGKVWDGTTIHETLTRVKNTCGDMGNNACTNQSGEGGAAGSSFVVGAKGRFLDVGTMPAVRNRFYDTHSFVDKTRSLLHQLNKERCEVQCEQSYDCGGTRFGPDFVITYSMTRDSVARSGGGFNAVTRVALSKSAKSATAPTAGSGSAAP